MPFRAVTPTLDGEVLAVLAGAHDEFTGRQVHRLARRGSAAGIQRALERLSDEGIVLRRQAGRAYLYQLNRDHLAADAVVQLASVRTRLVDRLRDEIGRWKPPASFAALFGSTARGDSTTASDVDVVVVRAHGVDADDPAWRANLDGLAQAAGRWTGNDLRVLEIAEGDLALAHRPAVVREALGEGIVLAGRVPPGGAATT